MINFLIDLYRKAVKGDNFRPTNSPIKYNDQIAQLNTANPNQASKLNTNTINKIQKTKPTLSQSTSGNSVLPGTK
jgi:hypothetical protein